ncbi:hypothetical protein ABZ642_40570 [Streptomyces sp. NPDC007157]|uniref:NACHT domain-containing protein n=1 Tax=Streptomyces sp. NPDC007157 TaxID=3154681 RepID=UPI0033EF4F46
MPRFELQSFSRGDLYAYATRWFHDLDDPCGHAEAFLAGLERSRMDALARTPLMASMLCQLYSAAPARPLPEGRTGAYQAFVELVYEQNAHKNIRDIHDQAISGFRHRHQIPHDVAAAEQAAQQVRDHLSEIIDHLAYERINGATSPAVEVMSSHLHVNRPRKVKENVWTSFLEDLLRPTGLLIQRADDLNFLHHSLLEYHAARHATRDERVRAQLFLDLTTTSNATSLKGLGPALLAPSYLDFLLDQLLAADDNTTAQTTRYLETLTTHATDADFLITQVDLGTSLPPGLSAVVLTNRARDATLYGIDRLHAAEALTRVHGYRDQGAACLTALVQESLPYWHRLHAAEALTRVHGYRDQGAACLTALVQDITLHISARLWAAQMLAQVGGHEDEGAAHLARMAQDTALEGRVRDGNPRLWAAQMLTQVGGHEDEGAAHLARMAQDTTLSGPERVHAATQLTQVGGYEDEGAAHLARLAQDTTLHKFDRRPAAEVLVRVHGHRDEGAACLTLLACTTSDGPGDVWAAKALTGIDEYRNEGVAHLARLAQDTTLNGLDRVDAAAQLARVGGHEHEGVAHLIHLAQDTTLRSGLRLSAARDLAYVEEGGYRDYYPEDDYHDDDVLMEAAQALERVAWDDRRYAALLSRLAQDTTLHSIDRLDVASELTEVDGYEHEAAACLVALAQDTTLHPQARLRAAHVLAQLGGSEDAAAAYLDGLATQHATRHKEIRRRASEALAALRDGRADDGKDVR